MEPVRISMGSVGKTGPQINSGVSVGLVLRGRIYLRSGKYDVALSENHMAVLNHNDLFSMESDGPNVLLWIQMDRKWIRAVSPETGNNRYFCCSADETSVSEVQYDNLRRDVTRAAMFYFRKESGDWLLMQSHLLRVLYRLQRHFCAEEDRTIPGNASPKLQEILAALHRTYREPVSLESTAKAFFFSPAHLSRMFKRELGMTFLEYITALRLESARQELLNSDSSITRIAHNNGFSNTRALNLYFRRSFGCTPGQYRNQVKEMPGRGDLFWLEAKPDGSLETLARFVAAYENQEGAGEAVQKIDLPEKGSLVRQPVRIMDVGDFSMTLRESTQKQITCAQREIGFQYIRMENLLQAVGADPLDQIDCLDYLESYIQIGLTPFVMIDVDRDHQRLEHFLNFILARFGRQELGRWKFEFQIAPKCRTSVVRQAAQCIKRLSPESEIGFSLDPDMLPMWADPSRKEKREDIEKADVVRMESVKKRDGDLLPMITDFITVSSDPNGKVVSEDPKEYEKFQREYCLKRLKLASHWLQSQGCAASVYLVDWNTLTGRSIVEAGEFHRSALIADLLLNLRQEAAGFTANLNLQGKTEQALKMTSYSLSLFLYREIRRPLFFAFRALDILGKELLWESDGVLITRRRPGRYIMLFWNPCYIDPFRSLENFRRDDYRKTKRLQLFGLEPGRYRIKRFLMDKENGSTYNIWLKIDLSAHMDQDILDYMEHISTPAVSLEERELEDRLEIQQPLALNAVSLWSVRKIETP